MAQGCHKSPVQGEKPALQRVGVRMEECSELFGPFISKGSFLLISLFLPHCRCLLLPSVFQSRWSPRALDFLYPSSS